MSADATSTVLAGVGARLRALRKERGMTLKELAGTTGISVSTLSRQESHGRKPTLELLLPLARAHGVPLDELVGAPPTGDPRIHGTPVRRYGVTHVPLSRTLGGLQAYKQLIPAGARVRPQLQTHDGYEWLYVLAGRLRLLLGEHDLVLGPGEAAEFDTRVPHAIVGADKRPVELLSLFGAQGERMHVRARSSSRSRRSPVT